MLGTSAVLIIAAPAEAIFGLVTREHQVESFSENPLSLKSSCGLCEQVNNTTSHLVSMMLAGKSSGVALVIAILSVAPPSSGIASPKPNLVLALVDDLGFSDVGWRNSNLKTPHLDSLAKNGVILHRHYVFCYCSPTRGSLLTGRFPHHDHQVLFCSVRAEHQLKDLLKILEWNSQLSCRVAKVTVKLLVYDADFHLGGEFNLRPCCMRIDFIHYPALFVYVRHWCFFSRR